MPNDPERLRFPERQPRSEPIIGRPTRAFAVAAKWADWLSASIAGRRRAQQPARAAVAGWTFSVTWHLLVLAVLALEVHPFQIPQTTPTVTVELLPPLVPEPPLERIELPPTPVQPPPIHIKPIRTETPPAPVAVKPILTKPLTVRAPPVITPPTPAPAPSTPAEAPRTAKPIVIRPSEQPRPPGPVTAAPSLNRPLEIQQPPSFTAAPTEAAPAPPKPVSIQPQSQMVPQKAAPLTVLTNDQTTLGPIEIKPPDRPQTPAHPAAAGAPPAGAGAGGGGGGGGGKPYDGPIAGFGEGGGLHMTLGCLNPETYHLSAADRAACMKRLAREGQGARDLGPNIPNDKMAEYDRHVACHNAYSAQQTPGIGEASTGTRLPGLGNVPSLEDCGPGDR